MCVLISPLGMFLSLFKWDWDYYKWKYVVSFVVWEFALRFFFVSDGVGDLENLCALVNANMEKVFSIPIQLRVSLVVVQKYLRCSNYS